MTLICNITESLKKDFNHGDITRMEVTCFPKWGAYVTVGEAGVCVQTWDKTTRKPGLFMSHTFKEPVARFKYGNESIAIPIDTETSTIAGSFSNVSGFDEICDSLRLIEHMDSSCLIKV